MAEMLPATASDTETIDFTAGDHWIKYPRAQAILRRLEELLVMRQRSRMPNLIIAGPTNNGKTSIVKRFCAAHETELCLTPGDDSNVPVVLIQFDDIPDVGAVYNDLLASLMIPFRTTAPLDHRRRQLIDVCRMMRVRMLIFDEFHHLAATAPMKQRQLLQMVKYLGNELMIPIVVVGTREAFNAVKRDPQLANRFEPALLPRWVLNDDFLSLLATFEGLLPGDLSGKLTTKPVAEKILALSEGTIGEAAALLSAAARYAADRRLGPIDERVLDQCGYEPEDRRKRADGIE